MIRNSYCRLSGPIRLMSALTLVATLAASPANAQRPAPAAKAAAITPPQSAGISPQRLERLTAAFKKEVAEKRLPGIVMMIARKGKVVYSQAIGLRDPKATDPAKSDTLFRIYSMTKPIVSVAAIILMEDGVLQLTDPVSKWLPPFKDVKVATAAGEVAAERPMTVQGLAAPYRWLALRRADRKRGCEGCVDQGWHLQAKPHRL